MIRAAALLLVLAAAPAAAQSFAELAADGSPSRHERLTQAARKEGSLTLYTSNAAQTIKLLAADFEKRYGVRVEVWRASSVKVLQRLIAEKTAGRWDFDAASASSPELEALYREGLLQEANSRWHAEMLPGTMPAHRGWAPQFLNVFVQAYNTNAVKRDELPKRWADLLDPKWKGRLGVEAKAGEWYCALGKSSGAGAAGILRRVGARNGWSVRSGNSLLANMVVSGEVPLALAVYSHMIDAAKQTGAPVDWFALEPMIGRSNGIGVSRRPKHPNAALLFYEYSLGDEGQQVLAKLNYVSQLKSVPSRFSGANITFVDPSASPAQVERCDAAYEALIRGKPER